MNNQELQNTLKGFAKEDLALTVEESEIYIAGTKNGAITMKHENGLFQAINSLGHLLTGLMNESKMIIWLSNQYVVE